MADNSGTVEPGEISLAPKRAGTPRGLNAAVGNWLTGDSLSKLVLLAACALISLVAASCLVLVSAARHGNYLGAFFMAWIAIEFLNRWAILLKRRSRLRRNTPPIQSSDTA